MSSDSPTSRSPRSRWPWGGAAVLAVALCSGAWMSPSNPVRICREPFRYPGLVETWRARGQGFADHFPDEIPDGVTNVDLLACIGTLQANYILRVRYRTTPSEAEHTLARFRGGAVERYSAGAWRQADGRAIQAPPHFLHDDGARGESIEALVLGPDENRDSDVNYGVAADTTTGDVWFWAEYP